MGTLPKEEEDRIVKEIFDTSNDIAPHFFLPVVAFDAGKGKEKVLRTRELLRRIV